MNGKPVNNINIIYYINADDTVLIGETLEDLTAFLIQEL